MKDHTDHHRELRPPFSAPTPGPRFPPRDLSTACPWDAEIMSARLVRALGGSLLHLPPLSLAFDPSPLLLPPKKVPRWETRERIRDRKAGRPKSAGEASREPKHKSESPSRVRTAPCARSLADVLPTCLCPLLLPSHTAGRLLGLLALLFVPEPHTRTHHAPTPDSTNAS